MRFINKRMRFINKLMRFINKRMSFINKSMSFINKSMSFINKRMSFINKSISFINKRINFVMKLCLFVVSGRFILSWGCSLQKSLCVAQSKTSPWFYYAKPSLSDSERNLNFSSRQGEVYHLRVPISSHKRLSSHSHWGYFANNRAPKHNP